MMNFSFENMTVELNIFNLQRQPAIFYEIDSVNWLDIYTCEDPCAYDSLKIIFGMGLIPSPLILLTPILLFHMLPTPH